MRCVLKGELVDAARLLSDPLAPHARLQAGKGGVALEPLGDQLQWTWTMGGAMDLDDAGLDLASAPAPAPEPE